MRGWFERLPIHRKLVASALLITAVTLAVALIGLSAFDAWRHRAGAQDDARAFAQVLAENTAAAVTFREEQEARDLLQSVHVRDVVTRACIFLPDGSLFVGFAASGLSCPLNPTAGSNGTVGSAPIIQKGRYHGSVYVERNLSDLQGRLLLTALAGVLMFALAASAAYILAQRVNTGISHPISALARFARSFGQSSDAIAPAVRTSPDEIGELVAAFADMVSRVRNATAELQRSNDELLREKAEREAAIARQQESAARVSDVGRRLRRSCCGSTVLMPASS